MNTREPTSHADARYLARTAFAQRRPRGRLRRARFGAWLALALVLVGGCAPYRFGTRSLYSPDIETVYVPVFTSNSFRRNLGEWLTEAVIKEIEGRTPYKVVNTPAADSVLTGRILRDTKRVTIEAKTDEPREQEVAFAVAVSWVDRNGAVVREGNVPIPVATVDILQTALVRPEVGSSIATGQEQVVSQLAKQIVNMMEAPW